MVSYIFGGNTGETPQSLARKREMAALLLARNSRAPRDVGEGLNAIGQAILYRRLMGEAESGEKANRAYSQQILSALFPGADAESGQSAPTTPSIPRGNVATIDTDPATASDMELSRPPRMQPYMSQSIAAEAQKRGISPDILATIIAKESNATFNPRVVGGSFDNKNGPHRGVMQFGQNEVKKYLPADAGLPPAAPLGSTFNEQVQAGGQYLQDRFDRVKVPLAGAKMDDIYSAVLAGSPGLYHSGDQNGTVLDHVRQMQAPGNRFASTAAGVMGQKPLAIPQPAASQAPAPVRVAQAGGPQGYTDYMSQVPPISHQQLMAIQSDPRIDPAIKSQVQSIFEYQQTRASPDYRMKVEKTQVDIEKARTDIEKARLEMQFAPTAEERAAAKARREERAFELEHMLKQQQVEQNRLNMQTPGRKALDTQFAQDYSEWITNGIGADTRKNLDQLGQAIDALKMAKDGQITLSGPVIGNMPDWLLAFTNPQAINVREKVAEVAQRNLRQVLGGQFAQKEGEQLISRAYNPALSPEMNLDRVTRLFKSLQAAANDKEDAMRYFGQHGTLSGWQGQFPTMQSIAENAGLTDDIPSDLSPKDGNQAPVPMGPESRKGDLGQPPMPQQIERATADVIQKAKSAIANGADPQAVMERLQKLGINPGVLGQ